MWGHEYVRNLASEVGREYRRRQERDGEDKASIADLEGVIRGIISFHMKHNAEPEAVDLLMELDTIDMLPEYVNADECSRVGLYLVTCAGYLPEPDDAHVLRIAHQLYTSNSRWQEAMWVALKLGLQERIESTFNANMSKCQRRQLAYMLARHGHPLDLEEGNCKPKEDEEQLKEIMANTRMSEYFQALAKDLDVLEPKTPEDIYKSHLVEGRQPSSASVDSASQNLSATFVSAFVNAGFGKDKLMTVPDSEIEGNIPWVYKNKDHGRASAAASLGLVKLWDVEGGLPEIDKYLYAQESDVVAGALMGVGIVSSNVRNEADPAYALLHDSVNKDSSTIRIGALLGLGTAYAGTAREDIAALVSPIVADGGTKLELACFASLSLGLVFAGTGNSSVAESILTGLMTRDDLNEPLTRLICLSLGLLYLGTKSYVDATVEIAKSMDPVIATYLQVVLEACAHAGTGYVVKVQEMLQMCSIGTTSFKQEDDQAGNHQQQPPQQEQQAVSENDDHGNNHNEQNANKSMDYQAPAVLGMAMIAMGEGLGSEMAVRTVEHLLQYGDDNVRKACPLALALVSTSNPKIVVTDTLSRLSHDSNKEVAQAATLAIGLVSAGTNNARVAGMLRNLTSYYYKDPSLLFLVRVSQGLVHLGKGLLTLSPFHNDRVRSFKALCKSIAATCEQIGTEV
jgi:26S proteasome regulatory subunit N1